VGPITALTWALEMGEVSRFPSIRQAISYCGLCGDEKSSADKVTRTPLSKQRNKHIQRVLVEAAKLAPRQDHNLASRGSRCRELSRAYSVFCSRTMLSRLTRSRGRILSFTSSLLASSSRK
jgi:transposase